MSKEFIEKQLKLCKRQNKDERYDYLCSEFNCVNYAINLEKYTNKLRQENEKNKHYKTLYQSLKRQKEELRNYLRARIEVCDNRLSMPFCDPEKATKERLILSQCLEKMEELEGGSNESRQME